MIPPCCDKSTQSRPITKKALVVGVGYREQNGEWGSIPTSTLNAKKFAGLLRKHGYTNIVEMSDEDGVEERYRPTKSNLRREIGALCHGAQPGDRRVFYFTGHSFQLPCRSNSEEDGKDELLVTADGFKIRDNTLHNLLVKGLPKGSALTAIFDSCTSGTLLDLRHYKCNNVYRPWVNKRKCTSATMQNNVVRKDGEYARSGPQGRRCSIYLRRGSRDMNNFLGLDRYAIRTMDERATTVLEPSANDLDYHRGQRHMSSELPSECDGWCRTTVSGTALEYPDMISISSSNDGQTSWDAISNGDSISMTTFLADILEKQSQITLADLMTRLNYAVYSFTRKMHEVKKRRSARPQAEGTNAGSENTDSEEEPEGEVNSFQDLQLGSMAPLDMSRLFAF